MYLKQITKKIIGAKVTVHPPLTPPTRGGVNVSSTQIGETFPPPRWGRSGGGAELLGAVGKQSIVFSVFIRLCGETKYY